MNEVRQLRDCIYALGAKLAFGSYRGERIGRLRAAAGTHAAGDYVLYRVHDGDEQRCTVARPYKAEEVGKQEIGLLTDWLPCVGTPTSIVDEVDVVQELRQLRKP